MRSFREFTKESETLDIGPDSPDYTDIEQQQMDSADIVTEIRDAAMENDRLITDIEALDSIQKDISEKGQGALSAESASLIASIMAAGTGLSQESFMPINLSMEAIQARKKTMAHQIVLNIANIYQRVLDWHHHNLTMFNVQTSRLKKAERDLSGVKTKDSVSIKTKVTKYLLTDHPPKEITSGKEYVQEFKKLTSAGVPFIEAAAELAEDDLFSSFKQLWAFLTFNSDDFLHKNYVNFADILEKASKSSHMKVEKKTPSRLELATDILVGQAQFVVILPPKGNYVKGDTQSLLDCLPKTYMGLYRMEKYRLGTIGSGSVTMEINKKEAEEILKEARQLLDAANQLITVTSKISSNFSGFNAGSAGGPDALGGTEDYAVPAFTRTGRLLNRISMVIIESVPPSYNFALGNVKKAATIVEQFTKKAS